MKRVFALFLMLILTALTALAVTPAAMAERRALVIGLNTYDDIQPLTFSREQTRDC